MNIKKALAYTAGVAGLAALLYGGSKNYDKVKANPFLIKEISISGSDRAYYEDIFGGSQEIMKADLTGDGITDLVILYGGGHAFVAQGFRPASRSVSIDYLDFHRIHPETQEAEKVRAARPDFRFAYPTPEQQAQLNK